MEMSNSGLKRHSPGGKESSMEDVVAKLIDSGLDTGAHIRGGTLLHSAASCGMPDVVDMLLRRGAEIEARDAAGATPLHAAAESMDGYCRDMDGAAGAAALLVMAGADIDAVANDGATPRSLIEERGIAKQMAALRGVWRSVAGVTMRPEKRRSLDERLLAVAFWDEEGDIPGAVDDLVARGASPNASDDGMTCLMWAALKDKPRVVEALIRNGAVADGQTDGRRTALHIAAREGSRNAAAALLAAGADPLARAWEWIAKEGGYDPDPDGAPPAIIAERAGHHDLAEMIRTEIERRALGKAV